MIEVLYSGHPIEGIGAIPVATVFHQVEAIEAEITAIGVPAVSSGGGPLAPSSIHNEIVGIYQQISGLGQEIGHIQGETSETITYGRDGSITISERGLDEAMSLSIGFSPATAYAEAHSASHSTAFAGAATAAASYFNGYVNVADAVAMAVGDDTIATTTVA